MTRRCPTGWPGNWNCKRPSAAAFAGELKQTLRYGENSHQKAAFYTDGSNRPAWPPPVQLQGKELSYNNINDTDAAYRTGGGVRPGRKPRGCAIIKHANPCGVAKGATLAEAYQKRLRL